MNRTVGRAIDLGKVDRVGVSFENHDYRAPMKFGGNTVTFARVFNVELPVVNRNGRSAVGLGSVPLGDTWSWGPLKQEGDDTLEAMTRLAHRGGEILSGASLNAHPVDVEFRFERDLTAAAQQISQDVGLSAPMPKLAVLVVASAFSSALMDAYGKAAGIHALCGLGAEHMSNDLAHYVGDLEFPGIPRSSLEGRYLGEFVAEGPKEKMPLFHLVGALDPLTDADNETPIKDGLPETLEQYIDRDGLTHLKVKLDGSDLEWDISRVISVYEVASRRSSTTKWILSLDFNERVAEVGYLISVLEEIRSRSPKAYDAIAYVEQPTSRDLRAHPENKMHEAAKLKPVVIDESLVDLDTLLLAIEQGYTGVAFKACKGWGHSLVALAIAKLSNMFLCVQDLTCPGRSFAHSAEMAAWFPGVVAIEGNSRQYLPAANREWELKLPALFKVKDGRIRTASLRHPGLGLRF